jgi:hypothetical protein
MSIMNSDDFILHKVNGQIYGGAFPINNVLSNTNKPVIVGGGQHKLGVPMGLFLINGLKQQHGGDIIKTMDTKEYKNDGFASDNLYDTLLNKFMNGGDNENVVKKTRKNNKRLRKNVTRKKYKK